MDSVEDKVEGKGSKDKWEEKEGRKKERDNPLTRTKTPTAHPIATSNRQNPNEPIPPS